MGTNRRKTSLIGWLQCALGLHRWEYVVNGREDALGGRDTRDCARCGTHRVWMAGKFRREGIFDHMPVEHNP